jgi:hypothetical protein
MLFASDREKPMTRAEFRRYLNDLYPFDPTKNNTKGEGGRYRQTKRAYGDYLWHQDRAMFEVDYQEHLQKAGR